MLPKPAHLGPGYGEQFDDASVVERYHLRPPYPEAVYEALAGLLPAGESKVLDLGCGTGEIARNMAPLVARVDAVEPSARMLAQARTLAGGDASNIRWIEGMAEDAPLDGPYALALAGASFHWMAWDVVMTRLHAALAPEGVFALVEQVQEPVPWGDGLPSIMGRYSTNREFKPYDLLEELEARDVFVVHGKMLTEQVTFRQPVADYVESFHARNGFPRDRMTADAAAAFDREVTALAQPFAVDGAVTLRIRGSVVWGRPVVAT